MDCKSNMPTARMDANLFGLKIGFGQLVEYGSSFTQSGELRPFSDSWQTEASLTSARNWPVAWVANGRIYAVG